MTTVTISLPNQIAKKVDAEAKNQGFETSSEFLISILSKYFSETKKVEFLEFKKKPLPQVREEFERTGKYSKKFVDSLIEGLSESSIYADKTSK